MILSGTNHDIFLIYLYITVFICYVYFQYQMVIRKHLIPLISKAHSSFYFTQLSILKHTLIILLGFFGNHISPAIIIHHYLILQFAIVLTCWAVYRMTLPVGIPSFAYPIRSFKTGSGTVLELGHPSPALAIRNRG